MPGRHESPSGAFKPQTGLRSKCRVFSAARARRFRCAAAGRGLFSFGTKREPERTAVPGGHESPSGAFKPQTGLRSKCRVFSAARAQRFRRAGPTRKGLLAPFNPKEDGLHTKKLAASLNAFLCSAISRPLSRCGGSSPQGSGVRPLHGLDSPFGRAGAKRLRGFVPPLTRMLPQGSQRLQRPFAVTTPSREKENLKNPQIFQILKIKITFPLKMPRVKRGAFQIVRRLKGSPCKTKPFP